MEPAASQELPLKRTVPTSGPYECPAVVVGQAAGPDAQSQARELGSTAAQAVILGDAERARDLLARAIELDPTSIELGYRYARALEDLGERASAMSAFCRILAIDAEAEAAGDARARLETLASVDREAIPPLAIGVFEQGITESDAGRFESAAQAFTFALDIAPTWVDAIYNRGVAYAQAGQREAAIADLEQYLSLEPGASDANQVSQRIGQLQSLGPLPSAGTALAIGLFVPGGGQFYSGRALGGLTALVVAGGAAAAGFLIEEITVRCLTPVAPGADCPDGQIFDETTDQPYLLPALGAAAAVGIVSAITAFLKARGQSDTAVPTASVTPSAPRLLTPRVAVHGSRVDLSLIRIRY